MHDAIVKSLSYKLSMTTQYVCPIATHGQFC